MKRMLLLVRRNKRLNDLDEDTDDSCCLLDSICVVKEDFGMSEIVAKASGKPVSTGICNPCIQ